MRSSPKEWIATVVAVWGLSWAAVAAAHGGPPQARILLFDESSDRPLVVATFGILVPEDGGWRWVCPQLFPGGRPGSALPTVRLADGTLLVATGSGLVAGSPDACGWGFPAEALRHVYTSDVVLDATDTALVLESQPRADNHLWATTDGVAFARLGAPLPNGFLPERVLVAPSDPTRIYVSGAFPETAEEPRRAMLYRSSNRAASWQGTALALQEHERDLLLLGVDPNDPDRLWLRVRGAAHDRVVASTDGGQTLIELDRLEAETGSFERSFGFTVAPDGSVWYGNPLSGLSRAVGMATSEVDKYLGPSCLVTRGDQLWVCTDESVEGFAVGHTAFADPTSYTAVLRYADVLGTVDCAASVCDPLFDELRIDLGLASPDGGTSDGGAVGPDGGTASTDGGSSSRDGGGTRPGDTGIVDGRSDIPGGGGGCACDVSGPSRGGRLAWSSAVALGLTVTLRRRRRRSRRPRAGPHR